MDFSYTQEQKDLRDVAARMFSQRFTDAYRKSFSRGGEPYDAALWSACAAAGLLAATYFAVGTWFDLGRVDSLFLALSIAGLYSARQSRASNENRDVPNTPCSVI